MGAPPLTHPILARLASRDPDERRRACLEAPGDPSAVLLADALGEALGDPDRRVARAASDALVALARAGAALDGVLRAGLRSESPRRRVGAALTAGRLEPPDLPLLPALVEALDREEAELQWSAARLLVNAGRLHGEVHALLLGLLRGDPRARVRRMAIHCLRELARDEPETAAALADALRDPDPDVRAAARLARDGAAQKIRASSE